jgi:hypothetical protein
VDLYIDELKEKLPDKKRELNRLSATLDLAYQQALNDGRRHRHENRGHARETLDGKHGGSKSLTSVNVI